VHDVSRLTFDDRGPILSSELTGVARGEVLVDGRAVNGTWRTDGPDARSCAWDGLLLCARRAPSGAVALRVRNDSRTPRSLGTLTLGRWRPEAFSPRLPSASHRELIHGDTFQSYHCGVKCVGAKTPKLDHVTPSALYTVYQREGGPALLLGAVPPMGASFTVMRTLHAEPHCEGDFGFEILHDLRATLEPGQEASTSPVVALGGAAGTALMEEYGALWAASGARGRPVPPPLTGWNSWDAYSGAVSRADMDENIEAAGRLFGPRVGVFAIDEGWEQQWGSWVPNGKFASGLEDYCRAVRKLGRVPGIWTAPLLVNTYNPLFLRHPEWFALGDDGQIRIDSYAYGPMAYLDPTQEEVIRFVRETFEGLRACGFEYFKVDFSHCVLRAASFHDRGVGRALLLRRAFQAMRDAIGEDAYLLSCGTPYESVAGIADSVRISGDIHIYWSHVVENAAPFASRWWMQGAIWNCDPDFLVVRGPDTAAPPFGKHVPIRPAGPDGGWMAGRVFDEAEARAYALLVHLSGGEVYLGDRLASLNDVGRRMLERVLLPRERAAVPVDLFGTEQQLPRVWISRGSRDTLVGLFNWLDVPARVDFDPAAHGLRGTARDFWSGGQIARLPGVLPRRGSLALVYPA
jgi:hypothetical protein